ncbi:hypothetical protein DRN85_07225 [Methanosarcinales archaeon]|nr:MAG: hypothetical protein DRN85_07225 [Methanosarcinales archaeon]
MPNLTSSLDIIINVLSNIGDLPVEILHRLIFSSLIKAGLSLFNAQKEQEIEFEKLIQTIPTSYRGLVNGKLYINSLHFIKTFKNLLKNTDRFPIMKEANIHYVIQFLEDKVGRVDVIFVLDCASVPEIIALASKFVTLNHNVIILNEIFINPVGVTQFLTRQLESFGREAYLRQYAEILKERLKAKISIKSSTIDLLTHTYGFDLNNFLNFLEMRRLFDQINHFAKQNSVLITSDHGYDVVADKHGLYITHGYKGECPLNFSKLALFLTID